MYVHYMCMYMTHIYMCTHTCTQFLCIHVLDLCITFSWKLAYRMLLYPVHVHYLVHSQLPVLSGIIASYEKKQSALKSTHQRYLQRKG
jgi:hypothetical protein